MNHQEQIFAFGDDLDGLVERYRQEFDLTYAAAVGCLQMKIFTLCQEAAESDDCEDSDV